MNYCVSDIMAINLPAVGLSLHFLGGFQTKEGHAMEENMVPDAPISLIASISPDEVHKSIMRCYKLQNRIGRKQLGWIFVLIEGDFCVALGSCL